MIKRIKKSAVDMERLIRIAILIAIFLLGVFAMTILIKILSSPTGS